MTITLNVDASELTRTVALSRMNSPFGGLLIGVAGGRVCWLQIGDAGDTAQLQRYLRAHGVARPDFIDADLPTTIRLELEAYFSGEQRKFSVPLLLFGTEFQQQAWRELQAIPYGATITYGHLAARLGNPKALRAAGAAVGSNPVPIIVPCHRVIGSNGNLTGYVYSIDVKEKLLVHEGALLA